MVLVHGSLDTLECAHFGFLSVAASYWLIWLSVSFWPSLVPSCHYVKVKGHVCKPVRCPNEDDTHAPSAPTHARMTITPVMPACELARGCIADRQSNLLNKQQGK